MEVGKAVHTVGTCLAEVGPCHGGEHGHLAGGDVGTELQAAVLGDNGNGLPCAHVIPLSDEERLDVAGGRSLYGGTLCRSMLCHTFVGRAGGFVGRAGLYILLFGNDAVGHQLSRTFVIGTGGFVGRAGFGHGIAVLEVLRREYGKGLSGPDGSAFGNRRVDKAYDAVGGGCHCLFSTLSSKQLSAHSQGTLESRRLQGFHLHTGGLGLFGLHNDFTAVVLFVATVFVGIVVVSFVVGVFVLFMGFGAMFAVVVAGMAAASREGQRCTDHEGRNYSVHRVGIGVYNVVQKYAKAFANGLQKEEGGGWEEEKLKKILKKSGILV